MNVRGIGSSRMVFISRKFSLIDVLSYVSFSIVRIS